MLRLKTSNAKYLEPLEKRRYARHAAQLALRVRVGAKQLFGTTTDVSYAGLGVRVAQAIPLRQFVQLQVSVPGRSEPLVMSAMAVCHRRSAQGHAMIVGLFLYGLDRTTTKTWEHIVREIAGGKAWDDV